jgi:hypothetical protein
MAGARFMLSTYFTVEHHGANALAAILPKRRHVPRPAVPDGLRTASQAAAKLGCSIKTLKGHVATGALRYVDIGHGKKRPRRMFTDQDINDFIARQTREASPCPSTASPARPIGISISSGRVIAFTDLQKRPRGAKRKP